MASIIVPFTNNLPTKGEIVIGDCCYLYDYYYSTNSTHSPNINDRDKKRMEQVKRVSDKLVENNNLVVIIPYARHELVGLCERDIIGEESLENKISLYDNNKIFNLAQERFNLIEETLKKDPLFYIDEDPISYKIDEVNKIAVQENLKFKDAIYVDYGLKNDAYHIITVDKDFTRMKNPKFTIYVDKSNYNQYVKNFDYHNRNKNLTNNLGQALMQAMNSK